MEWINYHHLLYFWMVAREGTVTAASQKLSLAQPTISAQLRSLEEALGEPLFKRSGRNLVLTDTGRLVYLYADEIFSLGRELMDALRNRPGSGRPLRLKVGVADALPKLAVYRLLAPALNLNESVRLACYEGKPTDLLAKLSIHELDLVLADTPIGPDVNVRAFNHLLGECGVSVFATPELARRHEENFPASLDGAPFLLPTPNTALRRALDQWFDTHGIQPVTIAEFEDGALLKAFGDSGAGLFAIPSLIDAQVEQHYGTVRLGPLPGVKERFFAISLERKVKHPAVVALTESARRDLF